MISRCYLRAPKRSRTPVARHVCRHTFLALSFSSYSQSDRSLTLRTDTPIKMTSQFHYSWLRDNCQCPHCQQPGTKQKLFSSADVVPNVRPVSVQLTETHLELNWPPNSLAPVSPAAAKLMERELREPHTSRYDLNWLLKNSYDPAPPKGADLTRPTFWSGKDFSEKHIRIPYEQFNPASGVSPHHVDANDAGLELALEQLQKYGLCFITNVPTDRVDRMEEVVERFGPIRETFYQRSWDVKNDPNAKNIAYTAVELGLHMDLLYFEAPPGLQFLHCLKNSVTGGESFFVDAFTTAEHLRQEHPEDFETLCNVPVTFHYQNDGHHLHFRRPTIVRGTTIPGGNKGSHVDLNEYMMVYHAPPFQGPLEADPKDVDRFYAAFRRWSELLERPEYIYQTLLQPGDLVIFANRRVLHGRRTFDAGSGERHLRGSYVDWDDFKDRLRVVL
ncbi:hypothetical protein BJ742DRAFT_816719 [Cladochytrium replicatum]|nr:hypothetical protein BJ742DRAFT_816719 [Cladochytrium replicatum]